MRRILLAGLALALSACGEAPQPSPDQSDSPTWGTVEGEDRVAPRLDVSFPDQLAPRVTSLPSGSWVRDEIGSCVEREEWFVVAAGGVLDHVLASRSRCGDPSLARYVGRWSTDQQVATLRWSNREESTEREATFWSTDATLQLGAYVPVDGGWHRRDALIREVEGFTISSSVDVGLRLDEFELRDGAPCRMSATVTVEVDGDSATETYDFECIVSARADGFVVAANGMWEDGGWQGYLQRRGNWTQHSMPIGTAIFEGFQPVFVTADGQALWHERADAMYRFTEDSPPLTAEELGE